MERIKDYINTKIIGKNILYFDSIDSTNLKGKEIGGQLEEGTIIIADEQTLGRGRMGRGWASPKGKSICMTLILKPNLSLEDISRLTLVASASVFKALEKLDIQAQIKWPNDILLNNKKICGILTELVEVDKEKLVVLGIGINVNLDMEDFPEDLLESGTSLKIEVGKEISREELIGLILNEFEVLYLDFVNNKSLREVMKISREYSSLLGHYVKIIRGDNILYGKALDILDSGEILIEFEDGGIKELNSGEISIRKVDM